MTIKNQKFSNKYLFIVIICIVPFLNACNNKQKETASKANTETASNPQFPADQLSQFLIKAALDGDIKLIDVWLDQGANVNSINENGSTALMMASYNGHTKIIERLIDKGSSINVLDSNNRTALIYASSGPFAETVTLLLKHKADPNIIDNVEKWTALMFAAAEGNTEVVRILLKNGANKNLEDKDGESAYDFANANNHPETAKIIDAF